MSVSYLSEIESGRKYPKPIKLIHLAEALGVSYDELVSLDVDQEFDSLRTVLDSEFVRQFPFHLFGIELEALFGLVADVPGKSAALFETFLELGRTYGVQVEHTRLQVLTAANRQELPRERRRTLARLGDLNQHAPLPLCGGDLRLEELAESVDHGEEVVEIVRDATGQDADGFHLVCLPESYLALFEGGLGLLALRDVDAGQYCGAPITIFLAGHQKRAAAIGHGEC